MAFNLIFSAFLIIQDRDGIAVCHADHTASEVLGERWRSKEEAKECDGYETA
jgi:hypothetical protein